MIEKQHGHGGTETPKNGSVMSMQNGSGHGGTDKMRNGCGTVIMM